MFIVIEITIVLSTLFPVFHLINALFTLAKSRPQRRNCPEKMFSILIPCFNEEAVVGSSVAGLLRGGYSNYEAIYINDGSDDETFNILASILTLEETSTVAGQGVRVYRSNKYENFFVVDKEHAGKGAALNTGLSLARAGLIVTLDADSLLDYHALAHMNKAFEDESLVGAGGAIHVIQSYKPTVQQGGFVKRMLISLQALEYLKGFYIYKLSLSRQKAMAIISGAFGVFKKQALLGAGGYRDTLGEDVDITLQLHKLNRNQDWKMLFVPAARCYTQCPENLRDLRKQRLRWQKGFIDCICLEKSFLLKTIFKKSVSFHLLVEAVIVNLNACIFTAASIFITIIYAFRHSRVLIVFLAFQGLVLMFSAIQSLTALFIASRFSPQPNGLYRRLSLVILAEALLYRYFTLLVFLGGTGAYFWSPRTKHCWQKFARANPGSIPKSGGGVMLG